MTRDASDPLGGTPPWTARLRSLYPMLVLSLVGLFIVLFGVSVYAHVSALANQTPHQWAAFAWAASWGALAGVGLCGFLIPGLAVCVRPALFGLFWPGFQGFGLRCWSRRTALVMMWAGLGVMAVALPPLAQVGEVGRGRFPPANLTATVVIVAVAVVPVYALMLAAVLVRPARHQQPVVENGPPARRG